MRHCPYCGHACHGHACRYHADLAKLEQVPEDQYAVPLMRDELHEATSSRKGTEA